MKTITISSSLRFKELIKQAIVDFKKRGIQAKFPNLSKVFKNINLKMMKKINEDHFKSIRKTDALYVICPNGYIGTNVKVEIGYTLGQGKPVYFSEKTGKVDLDALATGFGNKLENI